MELTKSYQVLSDIVFKGFLTTTTTIAGHVFVFKTLNDKEYDLVRLSSGRSEKTSEIINFNLFYLVYSVFMIDGVNILLTRQRKIDELYKFFSSIPKDIYNRIFKELDGLREKFAEATENIEGFCYTTFSRKQWSIYKQIPQGIPGIENIGLNWCQEFWLQVNRILDDEAVYNREFSLAILIASASNHKGAKSIRSRHDADIQATEKRRKTLAREGVSSSKVKWSPDGWAVPVDTAEDLVAELERQMQGKMDRHDAFIEDHIKQLETESEKNKQIEAERLRVYREAHKGEAPITGSQRVLTPEEVQVLMGKKSNNLSIVRSDEIADKEQSDRFISKMGSKVLTSRK